MVPWAHALSLRSKTSLRLPRSFWWRVCEQRQATRRGGHTRWTCTGSLHPSIGSACTRGGGWLSRDEKNRLDRHGNQRADRGCTPRLLPGAPGECLCRCTPVQTGAGFRCARHPCTPCGRLGTRLSGSCALFFGHRIIRKWKFPRSTQRGLSYQCTRDLLGQRHATRR